MDRDVSDTYAVYSAVLRRQFGDFRGLSQVLINSTTVSRDHSVCLKAPENGCEADYRDRIKDYFEKNKAAYQLRPKFDIAARYRVVDRDFLPADPGEWPRGVAYISLSAVAFNANHDKAVVYFEYHCGWLCGMGGIHFLTKVKGKWTVDFQRMPGVCGVVS